MKDRSIAFLTQAFVTHAPFIFSAARKEPAASKDRVLSMASLVLSSAFFIFMLARCSHASSSVAFRATVTSGFIIVAI